MIIGPAIFAILSTDAAVSAIVGQRISTDVSDQTTSYPQIVYKLSDAQPGYTYSGVSACASARVTLYEMSLSDSILDSLSRAVFEALNVATGTHAGVSVQGFFLRDSQDSIGKRPTDQNANLFTREQVFEVWYLLA